eukprot:scpid18433/ scgid11253/ 
MYSISTCIVGLFKYQGRCDNTNANALLLHDFSIQKIQAHQASLRAGLVLVAVHSQPDGREAHYVGGFIADIAAMRFFCGSVEDELWFLPLRAVFSLESSDVMVCALANIFR